ncbi:MAG TPA: TolC family protein [Steroidobacteraceae bacterium]|nr:TolC family protein [Steroidobacteraceae bacterium]
MDSSFARAMLACLSVCLAWLASSAQAADDVGPRGPLTLAQALDRALANNPELAASRYELTAAQARLVQAGKRPNPELSLELENFAGNGANRGTNALETTLAFSQVIELGGKRGLRVAIAESGGDGVALDLQARQLDLLADVTRRYIDVVAAQERLWFAAQNATLARQTLDAIGARVDAARSPVAERSRARIALTRADIEQRQSALALETARSGLALTWGRVDAGFDSASADLFRFAPIDSFETLASRLEANPDLRRFASETRLRDAELALARAQNRPNISVSLGLRRFQERGDNALVAGFSMPLAIYDRNQGNIAEARARRAQVDAERLASETRLRGLLHALYREAVAARDRAVALREEALPQAREALEQTRGGYERGRFSFLELLTTQQDLLALGEAAIDAAADYHRLLADIERLTSERLTTQNSEAVLP